MVDRNMSSLFARTENAADDQGGVTSTPADVPRLSSAVSGTTHSERPPGPAPLKGTTGAVAVDAMDDAELMSHVAAGNADAFSVLLERHRSLVFQIAHHILKDKGEAMDLVQQVFAEMYQTAGRFDRQRGKVAGWLFRIAYHDAINRKQYLKVRHFYTCVPLEERGEAQLLGHAGERGHLAPQEELYLAEESLAMLKPAQRRAIELTLFSGLTAKQAAERTGESVAVVENNLYRGLKKLRTLSRKRHL